MIIKINPSNIKGRVISPSSKSYAQRAVAIATLAAGTSRISNIELGGDVEAVINVVADLGAQVDLQDGVVAITPAVEIDSARHISIGESGLATRLFTPLVSLFNKPVTITGHGSILTRPISMMKKPLEGLGVSFESNGDYLPITVTGPMVGGVIDVDGSVSSQFLTGLLISLPLSSQDSQLNVKDLQSIPYIDMTIEIMEYFGVKVSHDNYKTFYIKGNQQYTASNYDTEGDWSGASAVLVAGAVAGKVTISNLSPTSCQADMAIVKALEAAGAIVSFDESGITVSKGKLDGYQFDATHCPDLFPALAALAANCEGETVIRGISRLTHKESDRAIVLQEIYSVLGIKIDLDRDNDLMIIEGGIIQGDVVIDSYNDHRIAMSAAVAALNATGSVTIKRAESVNKSYPKFWEDLSSLQY